MREPHAQLIVRELLVNALQLGPVRKRTRQCRRDVRARQFAFRLRLPGNYAHATPDTLQRRFLDTPGEIISNPTGITVKINRRAYSPVLREASLPADTTVPWWGGRQLRFDFA